MSFRILIRLPNWLGDMVIATPALQVLREKCPKAHITILALSGVSSALQGHPAINRVLTYDRSGRERGLSGLWSLANRLREEDFDLAYVFPNSFASALPVWLARIPERIGYATDGRSLLLTRALKKPSQLAHWHQSAMYASLVLGEAQKETPPPRWVVCAEERREAESLLRQSGIKRGRPLLALNPGSVNSAAKRWPVERYAYVARWAVECAGWDVVILGGGSDREAGANIATLSRVPLAMLAGQTSLRQFMGILSIADLVLSNDSGGMHVAAALQRPQLSLFGSTDAVTTGPLGPNQYIVRKPVGCSPCVQPVCKEEQHFCMLRIGEEEVVDILAWIYETHHEPGAKP